MNTTPFTDLHIQLGAKMVEFGGYNMPIAYSGIAIEHHAVRNNVGVFDVSHMGEFIVRGKGAMALLQYITSNDVSKLLPGKVQYTCIPNESGGIIDDLLLYCLAEETYLLVVNASNIAKDWEHIIKHNTNKELEIKNISDKTALLAIQGPKAAKVLQPLTNINLLDMKYYTFEKGLFAGEENVLISATGYTGSGGFEIYMDNHQAMAIWSAVFEAGRSYDIMPVGLAARDTLRLEKGYCLYGNEINDTTSPIAAGLAWITKFSKNFIGREIIENHKVQGTARKLVGFEMIDRGIPRHGYLVLDGDHNVIGEVTSGTQSPTLSKAIGMAYVNTDLCKVGNIIFIKIRDRSISAEIVDIPFVK